MTTLLEHAIFLRARAHDLCGYIAGLNPHQFPDGPGREQCRESALQALNQIRFQADLLENEITLKKGTK